MKKKDLVLVVDDVETNRLVLEDILSDEYDIIQAESGMDAISEMFSSATIPSIVLLDIMMPEMDGYDVLEIIKGNPLTEKVPVIFITAADAQTNEAKGLRSGAVDYISKPFVPEIVILRVATQIKLRNYSEGLEEIIKEKVAEIIKSKEKMLENMANIIECRNLESGHHVKRTQALMKVMLDYLYTNPSFQGRIPEDDRDIILKSVPLHDIGKIGIPDEILLKPGRLTPEEFEIIKTHSSIGSNIITMLFEDDNDEKYKQHCYNICRYHHERWDGNGYPDRIKGSDIPFSARLMAVVDVYDALVSPRIYKPAMTHEEAITLIKNGSGTQFDPEAIDAMMMVNHEFKKVHDMFGYDE